MDPSDITSDETLRARIEDDMRDSLDEELEMKLGESRLEELQGLRDGHEKSETLGRDLYFKELYACL